MGTFYTVGRLPTKHLIYKESIMNKIIWRVKQLLPLTYRSRYSVDGQPHFSVWNMWLGRVFNHEDFLIVK